jgi:hypothetical protein
MIRTNAAEPTLTQITASYRNKANVRLARAIHPLMTHCAYDRYSAHRWALKLIALDPQTGEDVAAGLVNYASMIEGALAAYATKPSKRRECDAVVEAYRQWRDTLSAERVAA